MVVDKRVIESVLVTPLGDLKIAELQHILIDDDGNTVMVEPVRMEVAPVEGEWLSQAMAQALYDWRKSGFLGLPPSWLTDG